MKKFEFPEIVIASFKVEDIVSTSLEDELPFMPFSVIGDEFDIKPVK